MPYQVSAICPNCGNGLSLDHESHTTAIEYICYKCGWKGTPVTMAYEKELESKEE